MAIRGVLKKHLHLHPYKITFVHKLKERDNGKYVEYCQWFRNVITEIGETFWTSHFVPLRHGFIYPFTSTAKRAMFGQRRDQRYTIT
jgi:hypothetical protein